MVLKGLNDHPLEKHLLDQLVTSFTEYKPLDDESND